MIVIKYSYDNGLHSLAVTNGEIKGNKVIFEKNNLNPEEFRSYFPKIFFEDLEKNILDPGETYVKLIFANCDDQRKATFKFILGTYRDDKYSNSSVYWPISSNWHVGQKRKITFYGAPDIEKITNNPANKKLSTKQEKDLNCYLGTEADTQKIIDKPEHINEALKQTKNSFVCLNTEIDTEKPLRENYVRRFDEALQKFDVLVKEVGSDDCRHNFKMMIESLKEYVSEKMGPNTLRIAVLGLVSSGKSYLINTLIGENILPVNQAECTSLVYTLKKSDSRSIKYYENGQQIVKVLSNDDLLKKGVSELNQLYLTEATDKQIREVIIGYTNDNPILDNTIIFDTPGYLGSCQQASTLSYIKNTIDEGGLVVILLDYLKLLHNDADQKGLIDLICSKFSPSALDSQLLCIVTKNDLIDSEARQKIDNSPISIDHPERTLSSLHPIYFSAAQYVKNHQLPFLYDLPKNFKYRENDSSKNEQAFNKISNTINNLTRINLLKKKKFGERKEEILSILDNYFLQNLVRIKSKDYKVCSEIISESCENFLLNKNVFSEDDFKNDSGLGSKDMERIVRRFDNEIKSANWLKRNVTCKLEKRVEGILKDYKKICDSFVTDFFNGSNIIKAYKTTVKAEIEKLSNNIKEKISSNGLKIELTDNILIENIDEILSRNTTKMENFTAESFVNKKVNTKLSRRTLKEDLSAFIADLKSGFFKEISDQIEFLTNKFNDELKEILKNKVKPGLMSNLVDSENFARQINSLRKELNEL